MLSGKKDKDGIWMERRMCGDYYVFNAIIKIVAYFMFILDEIFDFIGDVKYFIKLDLRLGFY